MNARILVADDDPDLRLYLKLALQREGYEVIEANDGEQAIARAMDSAPALILLDVMMPNVDGFDACRRLKSDIRTKSVPVIFISARIDGQSRSDGLRLGAEAYLSKPINPRDLSERVRMAIQRRSVNHLFDSALPGGS
jgi:DNA-binding response OmpR family regulator